MPSYQISPPFYGFVKLFMSSVRPWIVNDNIYVLLDNGYLDTNYPNYDLVMMRSADGGTTWTAIGIDHGSTNGGFNGACLNPYYDSTAQMLYFPCALRQTTGLPVLGERYRLFYTKFNFNSETWTTEITTPASGPEYLARATGSFVNDFPFYKHNVATVTSGSNIYSFFCADRNSYSYAQMHFTHFNGTTWTTPALLKTDDLYHCIPHSAVLHSDGNIYVLYSKDGSTTAVLATERTYHLLIVDTSGAILDDIDVTTTGGYIYLLYNATALKIENGKLFFSALTYNAFTAADGSPHSLMSIYHGTPGVGMTFTRYDIAFHLLPNDQVDGTYADWAGNYGNNSSTPQDIHYDGSNFRLYFCYGVDTFSPYATRPNEFGLVYRVVTDAVSTDTFTLIHEGPRGDDSSYIVDGPRYYSYDGQDWCFVLYYYVSGAGANSGSGDYEGLYNQQTWVFTLPTDNPALNFADTLTMYDAATVTRRDTLNFPVITVPICPDLVVNSGACTFVKTIDDDDPILTDCDEAIYSEPGGSCE